ncbi:MAG: hypothetical protein N3H31_01210 [Candidatus Nezhaarchaeota archaeon]|nr:hypothetical protein [Candidatus Nezhaarchaeota archaeon]
MRRFKKSLKRLEEVFSQAVALIAMLLGASIFGGVLFCLFEWEKVSQISAQAFAIGKLFAFEIGLSPLSHQTFNEAFFVTFSLASMASGLLLLYEGSSKPRETRDALTITIAGLLLFIIGSICLWWLTHRIFSALY